MSSINQKLFRTVASRIKTFARMLPVLIATRTDWQWVLTSNTSVGMTRCVADILADMHCFSALNGGDMIRRAIL